MKEPDLPQAFSMVALNQLETLSARETLVSKTLAKRGYDALERVIDLLELDVKIPSTKLDSLARETYFAEVLEALAERVAKLERRKSSK